MHSEMGPVRQNQIHRTVSTAHLRAGCRNVRLTARLANRGLTVTERLTCGRVARSMVSKPLG